VIWFSLFSEGEIMKAFGFLLILFMVACAGAGQQPERKWDVKVSKKGEPKIWVSKADGSKQCEPDSTQISPEGAAKDLKGLGVMVYQFRNGNDGMMRTAVCGAGTGNTVDLEIAAKDLSKAQAQGFKALKTQN
jgi:hypothetical protein